MHDVSHMEIDAVVHISDLKLPPGVKVLQDADQIVCQVREVREEVVAAPPSSKKARPSRKSSERRRKTRTPRRPRPAEEKK